MLLAFSLWVPSGAMAAAADAGTPDALKCTVVADAVTGRMIHRSGVCDQPFSPCSSFKLPLALMGFDSGILVSPHAPSWELQPEFNPSQRDLSYPRVDPGKHNGLTHAWLMSSLAISPDEQIQFLLRFMGHRLPVSEKAYEMTRATIPEYAAAGGWTVHGKSGSGWLRDKDGSVNENRPQGWFVGWAEKNDRRVVFARLEVGSTKSEIPGGSKAREEVLAEIPALVGGL